MTIGSGWAVGAWVVAGWVTAGNGAWVQPSAVKTIGGTSQLEVFTSTGTLIVQRTMGATSQLEVFTSTGGINLGWRIGATSQIEPFTSSGVIAVVGGAAVGGVFNAAEWFATGQNDVVITLYDQQATGSDAITLTTNVCTEVGSTGLYVWDFANIATLPVPYKEYVYVMTDGVTSSGGTIHYDDFLIQYLIHNEYGI